MKRQRGNEFPTFTNGDRVEMHPATDLWMRGARFGTVLGTTRRGMVTVQLDKLITPARVHPTNLLVMQ